MESLVIVGAGLAGLRSAMALREHGFRGRLTLLGSETDRPYDRPPLSKEMLRALDVAAFDPTLSADWAALDVELRLGCSATKLGDGTLQTDTGDVECDGVVLACGGVPRTLPAAPHAVSLRTRDDALAIRAALRPGAAVVVIGAGWIGAEVATAAAAAGCAVTVVESGAAPLGRALPPAVAEATLPWWHAAGIDLRLNTAVVGTEILSAAALSADVVGSDVARTGAGGTLAVASPSDAKRPPVTVTLGDGTEITADLVVSGIGVRPASDWLIGSGIALGEGGEVLTDSGLRTNIGRVVAVGDVASWESMRYARRLYVEHWDTALHGPVVATRNLLSAADPATAPAAVYDPVPYFWSQQFGHNLQLVGYPPAGASLVWRGAPGSGAEWSVGWFDGDVLVAVLAVDRARDVRQARRLVELGQTVDRDKFADPDVSLKEAAVVDERPAKAGVKPRRRSSKAGATTASAAADANGEKLPNAAGNGPPPAEPNTA